MSKTNNKTKRTIIIAAGIAVVCVVLWLLWKRRSSKAKIEQASVVFNIDADDLSEVYGEIYEVMKPILSTVSPLEYITYDSIKDTSRHYFIIDPRKYYDMAALKGDTSAAFVAKCVVADTVRNHFHEYRGDGISVEMWEYLASIDQ
ncbi:MAG: hypothetical protein K6A94_12035 [Bacteroidales bacterium]|nr:hypothetical protein [Bacteroidales bacterium]